VEDGAAAGGVAVRNAQDRRAIPKDLPGRLSSVGTAALELIAGRYHERGKPPGSVSVVLIDDAEIGRVHGEFMNDPAPTDVITFPYGDHGEILISVETAERQALEYGTSFERELTLYLVHGLLHLCGYEDTTNAGCQVMEEAQEEIVGKVLEGD